MRAADVKGIEVRSTTRNTDRSRVNARVVMPGVTRNAYAVQSTDNVLLDHIHLLCRHFLVAAQEIGVAIGHADIDVPRHRRTTPIN